MAISYEDATDLMLQYSEYLDGQNLIKDVNESPDDRDHSQLVTDFFEQRRVTALPQVEGTT